VLQDLTVDIQLALTGVTQTLSVTGEAPVLEATDARIGQVINAEQTVDLPLNGRQFSQLILLSPGRRQRAAVSRPDSPCSWAAGELVRQ
jgi:hypothetical protein